jgi:hypothetical protein
VSHFQTIIFDDDDQGVARVRAVSHGLNQQADGVVVIRLLDFRGVDSTQRRAETTRGARLQEPQARDLTGFSTLVSAQAGETLESNRRELSGLNVWTRANSRLWVEHGQPGSYPETGTTAG